MVSTGMVGLLRLLFGMVLYGMLDVEGTWAWEWDQDNFSPINRHPGSRLQHVGVRRSIYDRFWHDATPNNPFIPTRPSIPRLQLRLSENDFIVNDNDYDDDRRNIHWFPQMQHPDRGAKTLVELLHVLEGKLDPTSAPSQKELSPKASVIPSHKKEKEKKQKNNKQRLHRQRIHHHDGTPTLEERTNLPSEGPEEHLQRLPVFGAGSFTHDGHILNEDHFSKDILHDFQEQLSMPEHFTNPKQFPKDFISPEQFPKDFGLVEPSSKDHLTTDPFVNNLEGHEPFQEHLLLEPLPKADFQNSDHIANFDADQTLSDVDLPQMYPDLGILGKIGKPDDFMHQEHFGHFGLPNAQSPDILPESGGDGREWLPPSLSDLNLPSHSHMIPSLEQQKLSKEAHRGTRIIRSSVSGPDACHARNLHSCGSQLIDEFAFGPDNPDKCRIREEFLDCMEKVMKRPCELHGERYSREGTKLIRDKIKTLLWSAQGCILGYST